MKRITHDYKSNLLKRMNDVPLEISSPMNNSRINTESKYLHTTHDEFSADEVPTPLATTISESTFNKDSIYPSLETVGFLFAISQSIRVRRPVNKGTQTSQKKIL